MLDCWVLGSWYWHWTRCRHRRAFSARPAWQIGVCFSTVSLSTVVRRCMDSFRLHYVVVGTRWTRALVAVTAVVVRPPLSCSSYRRAPARCTSRPRPARAPPGDDPATSAPSPNPYALSPRYIAHPRRRSHAPLQLYHLTTFASARPSPMQLTFIPFPPPPGPFRPASLGGVGRPRIPPFVPMPPFTSGLHSPRLALGRFGWVRTSAWLRVSPL